MSVIDSSTDVSLANLTPEFRKPSESIEVTGNTKDNKLIVSDKNSAIVVSEQAEQAEQVSEEQLTPQQLEKVAQQLQDFVGEMNRGLEFSVDKDSGRDVIKVIDKSSGDLVKQYPSEEVLTLVAKLSDSVGGFIDAKV
ncbi:flagellar biosynthesis protein FlaG [Colwellia sp. PAMC 20917]|uniref:flagellar protein FlaG n=1 Tax=Colwellia sp. PAMC 20917 TaxID=1816218 RepID=UPI000877F6FA|nr:flagellar protein FlaG [Colwellia sp. PAMC 20917]AOW76556.1 flagellar biosynthesis protein FlaG [Colwellia sp. PAMC 20917]